MRKLSPRVLSAQSNSGRPASSTVAFAPPRRAPRPSARAAARGDGRVRYLHCGARGSSAARTTGLAAADEIIASIDDDGEGQADLLEVVAAGFERAPALGLMGGALLVPPGPSSCLSILPEEVRNARAGPAPRGFTWVSAEFALRRAAAEHTGRFDGLLGAGALFLAGEDDRSCYRLERTAVGMPITSRAVVSHRSGRRCGVEALVRSWQRQGTGRGAVLARTRRGPRTGSCGTPPDHVRRRGCGAAHRGTSPLRPARRPRPRGPAAAAEPVGRGSRTAAERRTHVSLPAFGRDLDLPKRSTG